MNSHTDTSLVAAGKVVCEPRNDTRESRVDGAGGDENTSVDDLGISRRNTHGKADNHDAEHRDDERASLADLIGDVGDDNCENGCGDVDGNSHQLGGAGAVSEVANDGREEQADTVERAHNLYIKLASGFEIACR